jgi:hypothetical protein
MGQTLLVVQVKLTNRKRPFTTSRYKPTIPTSSGDYSGGFIIAGTVVELYPRVRFPLQTYLEGLETWEAKLTMKSGKFFRKMVSAMRGFPKTDMSSIIDLTLAVVCKYISEPMVRSFEVSATRGCDLMGMET